MKPLDSWGQAEPSRKTQEVDRKKKNVLRGALWFPFPIFLAWTDFLFNSSIPKLEKFNQPEKHQNGPNRNQRNLRNLRSFDDRKETSEASSPWSVTPTSRWGGWPRFSPHNVRWQTDHPCYINTIHISYIIYYYTVHCKYHLHKPFHSR